jgi:hypothetical protein
MRDCVHRVGKQGFDHHGDLALVAWLAAVLAPAACRSSITLHAVQVVDGVQTNV